MNSPAARPTDSARGQTLAQAKAHLAAKSGLASTGIVVNESYSGFTKQRLLSVEGTVANDSDVPPAIDYMAQLGWSINEAQPEAGVIVRLRLSPQPIIGDIAQANGWPTASYTPSTERLKQVVLLPTSALEKRFGPWPGSVPGS